MSELEFSLKELEAWKKEHAPQATQEQFDLWIADCKRRGLVPVREVVMQVRTVNEYDPELRAKVAKKRAIYITTIGALRKLAERTGKYAGQRPSQWIYLDDQGKPTIVSDIPLPKPGSTAAPAEPWTVKAFVLRKDFSEPMVGQARFRAYAQTYTKDGTTHLNQTWATRGPEQLEKCAVAASLRAAFPEELGALYVEEEFGHDETEAAAQPATVPPQPAAPAPVAVAVPAVNHTPAEPTAAPRPNEKKRPGRPAKKAEAPPPAVTPVPAEIPAPPENGPEPEPPAETEPEQPAETPAAAPDPPPNTEEKQAIAAKLRSYPISDREALKQFVLRASGAADTRALSNKQWTEVLAKLDAATAAGTDAIAALLKGDGK